MKTKEETKQYMKEYNIKNRERLREVKREWTKNNPEITKQSRKKYYEKVKNTEKYLSRHNKNAKVYKKRYPEKVKAQMQSYHKIKIEYKQLCEGCDDNLAVERHHPDYSEPLNVRLLCKDCHRIEHRKEELIINA